MPIAHVFVDSITLGDAIVTGGTLLLAGVTVWLGFSTRSSARAAAKSADASEAAVKAALDNIEIDRQGVDAANKNAEATRALLSTTNTPYVVATGLHDGAERIHTGTVNGGKALGLTVGRRSGFSFPTSARARRS